MANKTIQLLRNVGTTYESHEAALTGLKAKLQASTFDGQPILARYTVDETEHTLLGIKSAGGYEIFDNEAVSGDIQAAINALVNGASAGFDTLKEIEDVIKGLDLTAVGGGDGDVLVSVSQTDGKVSASKASLSDIKLTGYAKTSATGDIEATDTVEAALSKLENKAAAITVASGDKTVKVTSPAGGGTDLAVNIDGTTLVKDSSTGVLSADLTVTALTAAEIAGLSTNVKEAYKLIYATDAGRTAIGDVVKIYKDSSLYSVYLGHVDDTITSSTNPTVVPGTGDAALCFIYQKADGTYELVAVNVESFLEESEFKNGLQVVNHEVSVKIDANSESVTTASGVTSPVLSVSTDGVKVDNIQDAIDYAVSTAIDALDYADTAVSHQFVTEVDETNGVITVTRAQPAASDIATTAVAADTTHVAIAGTDAATQIDNISVAIKAEETARETAIAGLDAEVTSTDGKNVQVKVTEVDGKITAVNITTDNSINATDLSNAINALDSSVSATAASGNVYSVLTGVTETDGKLAGKTEVTLAAVAKTGAAADVFVADAGGYLDATNVEAALQELCQFDAGTY